MDERKANYPDLCSAKTKLEATATCHRLDPPNFFLPSFKALPVSRFIH